MIIRGMVPSRFSGAYSITAATGAPLCPRNWTSVTLMLLLEGGAVEPLGFFPLLSGVGGISAAAGHAEAGNRLPHWCVAHLQVSTQVADDDDFVYGCSFFHSPHYLPSRYSLGPWSATPAPAIVT